MGRMCMVLMHIRHEGQEMENVLVAVQYSGRRHGVVIVILNRLLCINSMIHLITLIPCMIGVLQSLL